MSDEYMILHRPYAKGNTSWKLVRYVHGLDHAMRAARIPEIKFKKYDLFCAIPPEGVSDIPSHLQWLGIAISSKKVVSNIGPLDSDDNWLEFWEGLNSRAVTMLQSTTEFNKRTLVEIAVECLETEPVLPKYATESIRVARRWLDGDRDLLEIKETRSDLPSSGQNTYIRGACEGLLDAIVYKTIHAVISVEDVTLAATYISKTAREEKDIELAHIVRKHIPLAMAMMASYRQSVKSK